MVLSTESLVNCGNRGSEQGRVGHPPTMTAQNVWNYDAGKTIFSPICSSAYEAAGKSILVDYAVADNYTKALRVGLDSNHDVVFEFEYANSGCSTSWNAQPIALDNL
jgi:arylsulfate sulfotransferase